MARTIRRLAAVVLVCVSSVGAIVVTHQPVHGSAVTPVVGCWNARTINNCI